MNIQNLSLIFTPAIFQDHNQAQRSPGEWCKDCVLEDLVENCESLFANKDLKSASAITGVIEYGFENVGNDAEDDQEDAFYAFDLPSPTSSLYEDSPTTDEPEENDQEHQHNDAAAATSQPEQIVSSSTNSPTTTTTHDTTNGRPLSTEQPKFRAVSQDRGLKVDTGRSKESQQQQQHPLQSTPNKPIVPPPPTIRSATVPQQQPFDWLAQDPNSQHESKPLQRSATVGAKSSNLKRCARVSRANTNKRV